MAPSPADCRLVTTGAVDIIYTNVSQTALSGNKSLFVILTLYNPAMNICFFFFNFSHDFSLPQ